MVTAELLNGRRSHCGCKSVIHGYAAKDKRKRPPEYNVWCKMRQRCINPNNDNYRHYGGRGIKVCPRWDDFEKFLGDMGPRPEGGTIERRDVNGDYCPENCYWETNWSVQMRNRRPFMIIPGSK